MKNIFISTLLLVLSLTVYVQKAEAESIESGELIKASGPAVYYYFDGKRYVFPNEDVYYSWYADFKDVQNISDETLASVGIGGNVTYRPGSRLIKIVSDPKVYAVLNGNQLQWLLSEEVARNMFGTDWAKEVRDVSDALFLDYKQGENIDVTAPYAINPRDAAKAAYPQYAAVLNELIDENNTGSIEMFLHPANISLAWVSKNGYNASSTMSAGELYNFYKNNSADWTLQADFTHEYASGTAKLLNFSKTINGSFAHRSVIITDEPDKNNREFLFHEIVYPQGYLSYPAGVTFDYTEGYTDVQQGTITNASKDEVINWYQTTGSASGWTKTELQDNPLNIVDYYRMEKPSISRSLQHVYMENSVLPGLEGLLIVGSEYNKTLPE